MLIKTAKEMHKLHYADYWVRSVDTFMSGWGPAEGTVNWLLLPCDSLEEAEIVKANALGRGDQKQILIWNDKQMRTKPTDGAIVSYHDKDDYGCWYEDGKWS